MAEDKDLVTRFFEPWESEPINSLESAKAKIREIAEAAEKQNPLTAEVASTEQLLRTGARYRRLVWRGLNNSTYPLHSTLYRYLIEELKEPPTEYQMLIAEQEILSAARSEWRFGNLSALETFAQIRHYGGPTRFIDVSFNPLIALWFAVQPSDKDEKAEKPADGRIVAYTSGFSTVQLDETWGGHNLPWFERKWSEDDTALLWMPPSYNERISAQNSAFLIDGVPEEAKETEETEETNKKLDYPKNPPSEEGGNLNREEVWGIDDVRKVTSVDLSMQHLKRAIEDNRYPTFTIRISGEAKEKIRNELELQFGYTRASLYPDMYGLAEHAKKSIPLDAIRDHKEYKDK